MGISRERCSIGASGAVGRLPRRFAPRNDRRKPGGFSQPSYPCVIPRAKPVGISRDCRRIGASGVAGRLPRLLTQPRNDTEIVQQPRYRADPITISTAPCTRCERLCARRRHARSARVKRESALGVQPPQAALSESLTRRFSTKKEGFCPLFYCSALRFFIRLRMRMA